MKKLISALMLSALVFAGCQKSETDITISEKETFTASVESFDTPTKTSMNSQKQVVWSQNDRIAIFQGSATADEYQVTDASAGKMAGTFYIVADNSEVNGNFTAGTELPCNVAFYPYTEDLTLTGSVLEGKTSYKMSDVVLPSVQQYTAGSFANGAFPMVAVTETMEDHNLMFKNILGAIKLQLKGTQSIVSIAITGKNNERLSGAATVTAYTDGTVPAIEMTSTDESAKSVTLNCGEGVQLNESTATEFIIALPPVPFGEGFVVTITDTEDKVYTLETDVANNVLRSSILKMPPVTLGDELIYEENEDSSEVENIGQVGPLSFNLQLTASTATFTGTLTDEGASADIQKISIILHSTNQVFEIDKNNVSHTITGLPYNTSYSYSLYVKYDGLEKSSEVKQFTTVNVVPDVVEPSVTATTATFSGTVKGLSGVDKDVIQVGIAYSSVSGDFQNDQDNTKFSAGEISDGAYSISLNSLPFGTNHYYCSYVKQNDVYTYGEVKQFNTVNVVPTVSVDGQSVTATSATFSGTVVGLSDMDDIKVGFAYSSVSGDFQNNYNTKVEFNDIDGINSMSITKEDYQTQKYYYCSYILQNGVYTYTNVQEHTIRGAFLDLSEATATDLSSSGSANCYIVSGSGTYKFPTVKGNSSTSVGNVASCTILWESFGTNMTPALCGIIDGVYYNDGMIAFKTVDTFTKGNAVIAAKDADGKILWSWHIWLTDSPNDHDYYKNACTMMDRNLGATSATPGEVGALGLLYQWGRKDPFLGSSSTTESIVAASTITWPDAVNTNSNVGTINYVTANPTTFVKGDSNEDWYYNDESTILATNRWDGNKTIYDPCPPGWRVPYQIERDGEWTNATGYRVTNYTSSGGFVGRTFNGGMDFYQEFGDASPIWYPATGYRNGNSSNTGELKDVGICGHYWSYCFISSLYPPSWTQYWGTYVDKGSFTLSIYSDDAYRPNHGQYLATGNAVRCVKVK